MAFGSSLAADALPIRRPEGGSVTTGREPIIQNVLVGVGLWLAFATVGSLIVMAWNGLVVTNRVFRGEWASWVMLALSLPGYIVCSLAVGLGVTKFMVTSRPLAWALGMGGVLAVANFKSWGGIQYLGGSMPEAAVRAVVVALSVVVGCWLVVRARGGRTEGAGEAA